MGINESANTNMTVGLTINQGANDNHILTFKSSDVAHGLTGNAETDTYSFIRKRNADGGGINFYAINENDGSTQVLQIIALGGTASTVKSTKGYGKISLGAAEHDGANNITSPAPNSNLLTIHTRFGASNPVRFIFDAEGDGHADLSWVTFSDGRLKKNQRPLPYGLKEVMQLQPKIYDRYSGYLEDGVPVLEEKSRVQIGLVAQEAKDIVPELVHIPQDLNESWYSMDYDRIGVVLIKAIQEQQQIIEQLKAENTAIKLEFKAENEALKVELGEIRSIIGIMADNR